MPKKNTVSNFLPSQYRETDSLPINHNYLKSQFWDVEEIIDGIRETVISGEFTLGSEVDQFERDFAAKSGVNHAVGVGSGTDAILLSLKAAGVGSGDEVITTPFTFYATVGAIVTAGARPVFVDIGRDYNIDVNLIERSISKRTKAIVPVHWSGNPCDMAQLLKIAGDHQLPVIADACHAICAEYDGSPIGGLGAAACFSFHPLKNLNVWGDGGIVATNDESFANKLRLLRNHGLSARDRCEIFAFNSRLDTIQAVVARFMLRRIDLITQARISNSHYFDQALKEISQIVVPPRDSSKKQVFHIYSVLCERRDELKKFLIWKGIDAKIHYPVPLHLQPAASELNCSVGSFPVAEEVCSKTLSLPVHEYVTRSQQDFVVNAIKEFYG